MLLFLRFLALTNIASTKLAARIPDGLKLRLGDETGEGVVSSAIAVMIFAFLGVVLWVAFKGTMGTAIGSINDQVSKLGQ